MNTRDANPTTRPTPRFCSGCRKAVRDADPSSLCEHCGDRLVEQGYCPVCEGFWTLAPGAPCPKHEIELESPEAEPTENEPVDPFIKWVEVARFSDSLACQPPRIRLEAEGIPTMIDGERMGGTSMYHVAIGGVGLRVPEKFVAEARIILSQTWSATAAALDIDDWDEDDDDLGPTEPGAGHDSLFILSLGPLAALGILLMGAILFAATATFLKMLGSN